MGSNERIFAFFLLCTKNTLPFAEQRLGERLRPLRRLVPFLVFLFRTLAPLTKRGPPPGRLQRAVRELGGALRPSRYPFLLSHARPGPPLLIESLVPYHVWLLVLFFFAALAVHGLVQVEHFADD